MDKQRRNGNYPVMVVAAVKDESFAMSKIIRLGEVKQFVKKTNLGR